MLDAALALSDFLWGWPLIIIIILVSVSFSLRLRFFQFTKLGWILKNTLMKIFDRKVEGEGNLTPFQAAATALSATIGVGNIAGVGIAISVGGPGAIFWMWVVAFFSMINKYAEIVLGLIYRQKDPETGIYRGGGMYYIVNGLGQQGNGWPLYFQLCFPSCFCLRFVQSNTLALTLESSFNPGTHRWHYNRYCRRYCLIGGIKRIGEVAEKLYRSWPSLRYRRSDHYLYEHQAGSVRASPNCPGSLYRLGRRWRFCRLGRYNGCAPGLRPRHFFQ